jgi:hypothetical protein
MQLEAFHAAPDQSSSFRQSFGAACWIHAGEGHNNVAVFLGESGHIVVRNLGPAGEAFVDRKDHAADFARAVIVGQFFTASGDARVAEVFPGSQIGCVVLDVRLYMDVSIDGDEFARGKWHDRIVFRENVAEGKHDQTTCATETLAIVSVFATIVRQEITSLFCKKSRKIAARTIRISPIIAVTMRVAPTLVLLAALARICRAQESNAAELADRVMEDATAVMAHASLVDWKQGHLNGAVHLKGYESDDSQATDFAGLSARCANSVDQALFESPPREFVHVKRTAMFLVPPVTAGKLPALPRRADSTLVRSCTLEEVWYETRGNIPAHEFLDLLKAQWGEPNGAPPLPLYAVAPYGLQWGKWRWARVSTWSREGMVVRVGSDPVNSELSTLVVWTRNDVPSGGEWEEIAKKRRSLAVEISDEELATIAHLDPVLTKSVLARTRCVNGAPPKESTSVSADRLGKWLRDAKGLPSERRAAALLVAELYMNCVDVQFECSDNACSSEAYSNAYTSVGAVLEGCPLGGFVPYAHNFLKEAMKIGVGRAKDWADLIDFWGSERWGQSAETGERLAPRFPDLRAEIQFDTAMSHELRWLLPQFTSDELAAVESAMEPFIAKWWASYLKRDPDRVSAVPDLAPGVAEQELAGAVRDFTAFVRERPDDPAAVFAWQEVWRIQAGLKPSRHFEGIVDCE